MWRRDCGYGASNIPLETRPGPGASCGVDLRGVRGRETRSGSACSSLRAVEAWNRLDARTPTAVVILKPIMFGTLICL